MSTLIRNGLLISPRSGRAVPGDLLITGSRIDRIDGHIDADADEVIDATGALVMPGLVDTHTHAWQYAIRGRLSRVASFADYIPPFEKARLALSAEQVYDAILACSRSQLDAGVTGVVDFAHGANQTAAHLESAVRAHEDSGQRSLVAIGNTAVHRDTEDPEEYDRARHERMAFVADRASSLAGGRTSLGLGLTTPMGQNLARVREEMEFARGHGLRMTIHQNRPGDLTLWNREGLLGPDLLLVHSNTATAEEAAMLRAADAPLSITPQSEVGIGWSPSIVRHALRAGVEVSIGIDTPSTLGTDLWMQVRALHLISALLDGQHLRDAARVPVDSSYDPPTLGYEGVLTIATYGGAVGMLGSGESRGVLEPGALADVIVVRPQDSEWAFTDPAAYLVQAGSPSQVETVIVDGQVRKRGFRLVAPTD